MNTANAPTSDHSIAMDPVRPRVWAIATSDSAGAAGIQADIRTLTDLGVHPCTVVTAITAQNSQTLNFHLALSGAAIGAQLDTLRDDLPARSIKLGALPNRSAIARVAQTLIRLQASGAAPAVIADPVLLTSSGAALIDEEGIAAYRDLFPHLTLLTPNRAELSRLSGLPADTADDVIRATRHLHQQGVSALLVKGGHQQGDLCQDYYSGPGRHFWLTNPRQPTRNSRGTGCTLASAIAAFMAHGKALADAVVLANAYVQQGLRRSYSLGEGRPGPLGTGGWPGEFADFPQVSATPGHIDLPPFPLSDTRNLGLYPVVDSLAWLQRLLPLGVKTLQLRIKGMDPVALEQIIAAAIALGRQYDARLYINDYWQLALKYGAYGVHLGQEDLDRADLDALRQAGIHLGISTHSEVEWARAATLKPSYLAIGAIFPTTTKTVIAVGTANLQRWAGILHRQFPLVAIGGINLNNLAEVMRAPVGSVAVVSAITAAADPEAATRALLTCLADCSRHPVQR